MAWIITDDPIRDFNAWDREQEDFYASLPECDCCGDPIRQDYAYRIDGKLLCEECLNDLYKEDLA